MIILFVYCICILLFPNDFFMSYELMIPLYNFPVNPIIQSYEKANSLMLNLSHTSVKNHHTVVIYLVICWLVMCIMKTFHTTYHGSSYSRYDITLHTLFTWKSHANHNEEAGKHANYNNELYMTWYYLYIWQFRFFRSNNHMMTCI